MADPQAALATQMRNIETKTGKTFAQLCKLIADSGLAKVGEQRSMLMEKLSLGYGDANTLAIMAKDDDKNYKVIAENRRARYDYAIESDLECGIMLTGSEVKSLRMGKGSNIADSYASVEGGELWLINGYIAPYPQAMFPHEERRRRKLLASRRDIARMHQATAREGMTLVPLVLYFNHRGMAKIKIAVGKGKQKQDKRATEAKRDWDRQKARLMRQN